MHKLISKVVILGVLLACFILPSLSVQPVSAAGFLGLVPWNESVQDLTTISGQEELIKAIWQIVLNVSTDLTVAAAYLVIGFVIYGGYLYMLSNGDPGKVATGKKTLIQAFIGLAIVMSAHLIMDSIRVALLGGGSFSNCASKGCVDPNTLITESIQWTIGVAGVVAAIFVVAGGIGYMTSAGDPSKTQKAKNTLLYALIGLAIVALAEAITAFASGLIRNAGGSF